MIHSLNGRSVRSIKTMFLTLFICLLTVGVVQAIGGELIWEDELHIADDDSSASAIAVDEGRIFVAGFVSANNGDLLVRAYDGKTGILLWQDQYDRANQPDNALAIAAAMGKVFVAGLAADAGGEADFLVRAYDGKTGTLLWQDQVDKGAFDIANAITVDANRVFAAGYVTNSDGNYDFLVRGYNAKTGALLWEDQDDKGGPGGDRALTVTAANGRVYAAGDTANSAGNTDILVRTYEPESGVLIWETQYDHAGFFDWAISIVAHGGRVFIAGQVREAAFVPDFFVQAYDADTGAILWQDQHDIAGSSDDARAITATGGLVFAAGGGWNAAGNTDFLERTYDAKTGTLLWQDQFDRGEGNDYAHAIVAKGGQVFVAGHSQGTGTGFPGSHSNFVVRAYDAK